MAKFRIVISDIRPSGHVLTVYKAEFGCVNAANHKRDIIQFLEQLETECKQEMRRPAKRNHTEKQTLLEVDSP